MPKTVVSYLPSDRVSLDKLGSRGVLSFHYYDPISIAQSFLKIPDNMRQYSREWPEIFKQLVRAAEERGLVPWYPAKDQTLNQIIVARERSDKVDLERLPKGARDSAEKTKFVNTFT
jgi:hypothetical protein